MCSTSGSLLVFKHLENGIGEALASIGRNDITAEMVIAGNFREGIDGIILQLFEHE